MLDALAQPERGVLLADSPNSLGFVNTVAFSPGGGMLATGAYDGTARLLDVATHHQIGAPMNASADTTGAAGSVNAVAFSPGGGVLATAAGDGTARLWDVATHQQIGTPFNADSIGTVNAVVFGPGGILATADEDGTARLWDVATHCPIGAPINAGSNSVSMTGVAFGPAASWPPGPTTGRLGCGMWPPTSRSVRP